MPVHSEQGWFEVERPIPEWFTLGEVANSETMQRIAEAVKSNSMAMQVQSAPVLAHWFLLDSMLLSNQANREGMHANALALTRQCFEAIGVIELGICGHADAEAMLAKWENDQLTPGKLRAWFQSNVWQAYGSGLWDESWDVFMHEFASAIQPYAHYGRDLAQWQLRLHQINTKSEMTGSHTAIMEIRPRAYDAQKATRITLYHALLTYVLGRIWIAANPNDGEFAGLIASLGGALGKSRYLDGHATNWGEQFWAMLWLTNGETILE